MCQLKLLADSMLGALARKLRLLGIDTEYLNNPGDHELEYLIRSQARVLLTRNRNLAMGLADNSWLVSGDEFRDQFLSIAGKLALFSDYVVPFSRCLDCNEPLITVDVSEIEGKVPPYILSSKTHFSECSSCGKVFWEGTHSKRMREEVDWMKEKLMRA
jgi:uncharacterized protein with PIN domain